MIRTGVAFILMAGVLWILAFPIGIFSQLHVWVLSAIVLGILGAILVLIGVILDRVKEIKEDDEDDLSKY